MHKHKTPVTTPQRVKQYHRRIHASIHTYLFIYLFIYLFFPQIVVFIYLRVEILLKTDIHILTRT